MNVDPLCGCPIEQFAANRADRRRAVRRAVPVPATVTRHRRGCLRGAASTVRTAPAKDAPRRPR